MLKQSKQRNQIIAYLQSTKEHPTAEMVYNNLKNTMPNLSLATVYRNLNLLVDIGLACRLEAGQGKVRFDGNVKRHDHFVCTCCGKVYDLEKTSVLGSENYKGIYTNHKIEDHSLNLFGTCEECQKNNSSISPIDNKKF